MGSPTTWVLFSVPQHPTEKEKEAWRGRQIKKRVFFSTKADEPKAGPFSFVNVGPFWQNLVPRRLVSFLLFSKTNKGKLFFRWPEGPQCFHTKHPWGQIPSESKKVRYLNTKTDKATSHKSDPRQCGAISTEPGSAPSSFFPVVFQNKQTETVFWWPEGPQCFHTKHPWGQLPKEARR